MTEEDEIIEDDQFMRHLAIMVFVAGCLCVLSLLTAVAVLIKFCPWT